MRCLAAKLQPKIWCICSLVLPHLCLVFECCTLVLINPPLAHSTGSQQKITSGSYTAGCSSRDGGDQKQSSQQGGGGEWLAGTTCRHRDEKSTHCCSQTEANVSLLDILLTSTRRQRPAMKVFHLLVGELHVDIDLTCCWTGTSSSSLWLSCKIFCDAVTQTNTSAV